MTKIGWDDQGERYTAWDRIRDERRAEDEERRKARPKGTLSLYPRREWKKPK